jgi:hypothetical protein
METLNDSIFYVLVSGRSSFYLRRPSVVGYVLICGHLSAVGGRLYE